MKRRRKGKPNIMKIMLEGTLVDEAIARAMREAVRKHVQAGNPIAVAEGGKVRWLKPSQVPLEHL